MISSQQRICEIDSGRAASSYFFSATGSFFLRAMSFAELRLENGDLHSALIEMDFLLTMDTSDYFTSGFLHVCCSRSSAWIDEARSFFDLEL